VVVVAAAAVVVVAAAAVVVVVKQLLHPSCSLSSGARVCVWMGDQRPRRDAPKR